MQLKSKKSTQNVVSILDELSSPQKANVELSKQLSATLVSVSAKCLTCNEKPTETV